MVARNLKNEDLLVSASEWRRSLCQPVHNEGPRWPATTQLIATTTYNILVEDPYNSG